MGNQEQDAAAALAEVLWRLDEMHNSLTEMEGRLTLLEQHAARPAVPTPPRPAAAPPVAAPPATSTAPLPPLVAAPVTPLPAPPSVVSPPAATVPQPVLKRPPEAPPTAAAPRRLAPPSQGWELEIGLKWMGRAGAVALILAALYFLQYAFVNRLIGPTGQVLIGLVAGLALLVLGDKNLRLGRRAFGEALLGAGLALLYISIFAAYAFYRPPLLDFAAAFAFLVLVTALAVGLALRADAQSTALLAALGGFLTPVLLRRGQYGGDELASLVQLFSYLTLLDLGLLALVYCKRWRALQVLAFVGSWLVLWGWLDGVDSSYVRFLTIYPALVFFAIFLLMPIVRNLRQGDATQPEELGLLLANPACFFPTLMSLAAIYYADYLGLLAVVLAGVYLMLGQAAWRRNPDDRVLSLTWLSLGLVLVTLAVPLQFDGEWILLSWGLEGTLLIWIGLRLQAPVIRVLGFVLQTVVWGWLLLLFVVSDQAGQAPEWLFANPLFLSFVGGAATLALTLAQYQSARVAPQERGAVQDCLSVALGVLALWGPTSELARGHLPAHLALAWWAVASAALTTLGLRWRRQPLRVAGLIAQGVVVVWLLLLYSLFSRQQWLTDFMPLFNEVFIVFLLGLLSVGWTLHLYNHAGRDLPETAILRPALAIVLAVLGLWGLTADVGHGLKALTVQNRSLVGMAGFGISLVWCLYASGLVWYGISRRQAQLRTVGLAIFALAVLKVFAWDSLALQRLWRILSFVCLGLLLISVSYLYHLYGERLRELFASPTPASPEAEASDGPTTTES